MKRALAILFTLAFASALAAQQTEAQKLHKLFDDDWEWNLRDDPEGATYVGDRRFDHLLTPRTAEAVEGRRAHDREVLGLLYIIDRA